MPEECRRQTKNDLLFDREMILTLQLSVVTVVDVDDVVDEHWHSLDEASALDDDDDRDDDARDHYQGGTDQRCSGVKNWMEQSTSAQISFRIDRILRFGHNL